MEHSKEVIKLTEMKKPTEIRLFISSTFEDMKAERDAFNNKIFPKLQRMCRDKGISFFVVDLRWGISQEDIQNNQLIPLCLDEVDKCRPFFLGMIGLRYGSTIENIPENLFVKYPWLQQKKGASYTELEITYHFQKNNNPENMLFLFKDTDQTNAEDPRLLELKGFIQENAGERVQSYDDLDTFEEVIVQQFQIWLDSLLGNTDVHLERERYYERELLSRCIHNVAEEKSIRECIKISESTILLHGDGPLGKTTLLNSIAGDYPEHAVINCAADEANGDWQYVVQSIYKKIKEIAVIPEEEKAWFENIVLGKIKNEDELVEHCRAMLESVECKKDTILVINDLEYIFGTRTKYLQWIPTKTKENFRIVCSSNDFDVINSARLMAWQLLEQRPMETQTAETLLESEMSKIGKSAKTAKALLQSPLAGYPGFIKTAIDFLNCFGSFDTIEKLSVLIGENDNFNEFYGTIFDYIRKEFPEETVKDLTLTLGAMAISPVPLDEAARYALLQQANGASKVRWATVCELISGLRMILPGETISSALRRYLQTTLTETEKKLLHNGLGMYHLSLLDDDLTICDRKQLSQISYALLHFSHAENVECMIKLISDTRTVVELANCDFDSLRLAYAKVLFCSERNISKMIYGTMLDAFEDKSLDEMSRAVAVIKLWEVYQDLQLEGFKEISKVELLLEQVCQQQEAIPAMFEGSVFMHRIRGDIYSQIGKKDPLDVLDEITESITPLCDTAQMRAVLLNARADVLIKYRYQEVMDDVELALQQSIRAASIENLLFAYEMKVMELIRQRQFEDALEYAQVGCRWAKEKGYVFFDLAFSNHKMVCLYRMNRFAEAIEVGYRYMELCSSFKSIRHRATFAQGIAMAYLLNGRDEECIALLEDELKEKNLLPKNRVALSEVLCAAYSNLEKYDEACKLATDILNEKELDPAKELSFTIKRAMMLSMKEGRINGKTAKLFERGFQMAKKNNNTTYIHVALTQFYPLFLASKEGQDLLKRWDVNAEQYAYLRKLTNSEELFANALPFVSIGRSKNATTNVSKLMNTYQIAMERKQFDQAAKAACDIARSYETMDPVEEGKWYKWAAEVSDGEQKQKILVKGLFAIFNQGKPMDANLLSQFMSQMDPADCKSVERWKQLGEKFADNDYDEAFELLRAFIKDGTNQKLVEACIGDLSASISSLPITLLEAFYKMALDADLNPLLVEAIVYTSANTHRMAYESCFGEDVVKNAEKNETELVSIIHTNAEFKIIGQMMGGQVAVQPRYKCKNLDHVFGTVGWDQQKEHMLCITDIVFPSMNEELQHQLKNYVSKVTPPEKCNIQLQPSGQVKCMMSTWEDPRGPHILYKMYSNFVMKIVRELDEMDVKH